MATRQWLDNIRSVLIRRTRRARASHPRLRQTAALVFLITAWLIAAWQIPGVSSGESDRYAAAAHGVPDRIASRSRTELSPHVDRIRFAWPVQGSVTSRFGRRGFWGWHRGVDIKAPRGTPIHAAAAGIVIFSGRQSGYGRVIKIAHPNGLTTIYAHNSANFVKVGDRVKGGALIGAVGRTGHATTNHLHFEIRRQGMAHDPLPMLQRLQSPISTFLHDDLPTARQAAREFLVHYAGMPHYAKALEASGFAADMEGVRKGLATGAPSAAMAALSDRLLDEVLLVGPAARCRDQLEAFCEAGAEWATLGPQRVGNQDLAQQARVVVADLAPR